MLAVIRRKVGPSAAQRDPERTTNDNHGRASLYTRSITLIVETASAMSPFGRRFCSIASTNSATSRSHDRSGNGHSQRVVSGGPISGDMRKNASELDAIRAAQPVDLKLSGSAINFKREHVFPFAPTGVQPGDLTSRGPQRQKAVVFDFTRPEKRAQLRLDAVEVTEKPVR